MEFPEHTIKLRGHRKNDLIIIYSKYEDLVTEYQTPEAMGLNIPQWFCIDYTTMMGGISRPLPEPSICTYEKMKEEGIATMEEHYNVKIKRVLFYHAEKIFLIKNQAPFPGIVLDKMWK